jgi:hypothetical protein
MKLSLRMAAMGWTRWATVLAMLLRIRDYRSGKGAAD